MTDLHAGETAAIHVARVSLRNEPTVEFAAATASALEHELASWCRQNWAAAGRAWDALADQPPNADALAIEEYFEVVLDGTILKRATVEPSPPAATDDRDEAEVMADYNALDTLVSELLAQRTSLARAVLRRLEARQTAEPEQPLSDEHQRLVKRLVVAIMLDEAAAQATMNAQRETESAALESLAPVDDGLAAPREILERIAAELPARSFERRIQWRIEQLERILALNDASPVPLADDERALRESVSMNARALIDARRVRPPDDAGDGSRVQVAYLMPVEVVVDLDQQRVTKVFGVDEALELDPLEGVRAETTLSPIAPGLAGRAVAITESARGWTSITFG
jgi:hypothetical protein